MKISKEWKEFLDKAEGWKKENKMIAVKDGFRDFTVNFRTKNMMPTRDRDGNFALVLTPAQLRRAREEFCDFPLISFGHDDDGSPLWGVYVEVDCPDEIKYVYPYPGRQIRQGFGKSAWGLV